MLHFGGVLDVISFLRQFFAYVVTFCYSAQGSYESIWDRISQTFLTLLTSG